ncbi:MAG: GFA family protein [Lentisphaerota bacterium]
MNPKQFEGQCQCAEVQYRVTGIPITVFACHCHDCQRQSSSAFGMALWLKEARVDLLHGELKKWIRHTPLGKEMECSFCPACGTRLFHKILGQSEILSIKPGTLNDTSWLKPAGHLWTKSAQSWVHLDEDVLHYEGNPDSFSELISAWMKENHA